MKRKTEKTEDLLSWDDIDEECMEGLANPVPKEELSNSFIVVAGGHDAVR